MFRFRTAAIVLLILKPAAFGENVDPLTVQQFRAFFDWPKSHKCVIESREELRRADLARFGGNIILVGRDERAWDDSGLRMHQVLFASARAASWDDPVDFNKVTSTERWVPGDGHLYTLSRQMRPNGVLVVGGIGPEDLAQRRSNLRVFDPLDLAYGPGDPIPVWEIWGKGSEAVVTDIGQTPEGHRTITIESNGEWGTYVYVLDTERGFAPIRIQIEKVSDSRYQASRLDDPNLFSPQHDGTPRIIRRLVNSVEATKIQQIGERWYVTGVTRKSESTLDSGVTSSSETHISMSSFEYLDAKDASVFTPTIPEGTPFRTINNDRAELPRIWKDGKLVPAIDSEPIDGIRNAAGLGSTTRATTAPTHETKE